RYNPLHSFRKGIQMQHATSSHPNLIVGQSGGPTAVINASLVGVVDAAVAAGIRGVYGMRGGVQGALEGALIDLAGQSPAVLASLRQTPAAALGSCRYKLRPSDPEQIIDLCRHHDVGYFVYIGGNDSADTSHRIARAAQNSGYDLRVVGVPKTIDNDLPITDHCPGYGSIARFLALATRDAGLDTESMRRVDPIKLIEVQGRNAGWIAASTALGKRDDRDAPHLVYVPERRVDLDTVLREVEATYRRIGYCVIVVSETLRDPSGQPLGSDEAEVDAFGHRRVAGAAQFLAGRITRQLGVRARFDKPGTIARMSIALASPVDLAEAYQVGQAAVTALMRDETDKMVTLVREQDNPYQCITGLAPLTDIANSEKLLPKEFLSADGRMVTDAFRAYAEPLIGEPVPGSTRLADIPVRRG
ncbi:MAG TPA: 6-phosphofructokinase, partial [Chloroflexota bacterium]|nr:6-phosphofructokinase [Chloroflexota bacterium]